MARPGPDTTPRHTSEVAPGLEMVYGRNPVREALRGRRKVHTILLATGRGEEELARLLPEWWCGRAGRAAGRSPPGPCLRCDAWRRSNSLPC